MATIAMAISRIRLLVFRALYLEAPLEGPLKTPPVATQRTWLLTTEVTV